MLKVVSKEVYITGQTHKIQFLSQSNYFLAPCAFAHNALKGIIVYASPPRANSSRQHAAAQVTTLHTVLGDRGLPACMLPSEVEVVECASPAADCSSLQAYKWPGSERTEGVASTFSHGRLVVEIPVKEQASRCYVDPVPSSIHHGEGTNRARRDEQPIHGGCPESSKTQSSTYTWALLTSLVGIGIVIFGVLAGGKVTLYFLTGIALTVPYVMVDFFDHTEAFFVAGQPASELDPLKRKLAMRGLCWLGIGIADGTFRALHFVTFDANFLAERWQPEAMLYDFLCLSTMVLRAIMMGIHRDRRGNVMKWCLVVLCACCVFFFGRNSPYDAAYEVGAPLYILVTVVCAYVLVAFIVKEAQREDVRGG